MIAGKTNCQMGFSSINLHKPVSRKTPSVPPTNSRWLLTIRKREPGYLMNLRCCSWFKKSRIAAHEVNKNMST